MKVCKSAYFEFDDEKNMIRFVWGKGKSRNQEFLRYDSQDFYSIAKKVFQEFLAEQDLRIKISKLAHAMNLGSDDARIRQICFMLEVMWRYDFDKKEMEKEA